MKILPFLGIIGFLINPFKVFSQNASGQYLSPSMRAGEYLGSIDLPNFSIELGVIDFGLNLNFNAGDILKGNDQTLNVKNLSQNRDYLVIHNELSSNLFAVTLGKKATHHVFGIGLNNLGDLSIDRDLIQIATVGFPLNNDGIYSNNNDGINISQEIWSNLFYGITRKVGKNSIGLRVNYNTLIAGAQIETDEFKFDRISNSDTNFIGLKYRAGLQIAGFENYAKILTNDFSSVQFIKTNGRLSIDFGIEKQLKDYYRLGVSLNNIWLNRNFGSITRTVWSGEGSFSGADYVIGTDSMSDVVNDLVNYDLNGFFPDTTQESSQYFIAAPSRMKVYFTTRLSSQMKLIVSNNVRWYPNRQDYTLSAFVFNKPNKILHLGYGINWWLNYNIIDLNLAGKILFAPYSRLSIGFNNPFNIPLPSAGSVRLTEGFSGANIFFGLSFGKYVEKDF